MSHIGWHRGLFVFLHLEVDLRVHPGVEIVIGNDLLRLGVDHLFRNADPNHSVNERDDPIETAIGETSVLVESLH